MVSLAEAVGDTETAVTGRAWRFVDLMEIGDIAEADVELEELARTANQLRQPVYLYLTHLRRTMRLLLDGRFAEVEQMASRPPPSATRHRSRRRGRRSARRCSRAHASGAPRRAGGSGQRPRGAVSGVPSWRAVLAFLYSELGRRTEARAELERLAANDFADLPRDLNLNVALTQLAAVCAYLADFRRAALVYELMKPVAHRCVVAAGTAPLGSASRPLGLLAAAMRRWEDAARHFEDALRMNTRIGSRPWIAHTQFAYAEMLLARGEPADREKARALLSDAPRPPRSWG